MKNLFSILGVFVFSTIFAQKNAPDFIDCYRDKGANFCLKKDKTFLIIGFGTFITGTWEVKEIQTKKKIKNQKFIELTPYRPELPFSVFERKLKLLI